MYSCVHVLNVTLHFRYWYNNGCMFPDMCSVFIAIDDCSKENGCLQVGWLCRTVTALTMQHIFSTPVASAFGI